MSEGVRFRLVAVRAGWTHFLEFSVILQPHQSHIKDLREDDNGKTL